MTDHAGKAIAVDLGPFAERVQQRVRDGEYDSVSDVVRAGLEALDREDEAFDAVLRAKVAEALADPRPDVSIEDIERDLERLHRDWLADHG